MSTNRQISSILDCSDLGCQVGRKVLLEGVSFSLNSGERCAVVGPNGAGKTTLIKLLLGQQTKSCGEVILSGDALSNLSRNEIAKRMAYVPQLVEAEIPYIVSEFVGMGRYAHGGDEHDEEVQKAMELVNVSRFRDRRVATLSGGERQRVCIAAALAQQVKLLVLDEPLSHLDPGQRLEVRKVLDELPKDMTVIAVTHDMDWLTNDFDRVLCLKEGKLVADVNPQKFVENLWAEKLYGQGVGRQLLERYKEEYARI